MQLKNAGKFTVELLRDAYVSDTFSIKLISLDETNIFHSYIHMHIFDISEYVRVYHGRESVIFPNKTNLEFN